MDEVGIDAEAQRESLRREAYDLKVSLAVLSQKLLSVDKDASWAARQARLQAFAAWTILATPLEEEEDH